eukprot:379038-Pleurochrysis_carterae.AAC.1
MAVREEIDGAQKAKLREVRSAHMREARLHAASVQRRKPRLPTQHLALRFPLRKDRSWQQKAPHTHSKLLV